MKKIAFYLENKSISGVDCSSVLEANPGIGGTEWLIIVIATLLSKRNNGLDISLYVESPGVFPPGIIIKTVGELKNALIQGVSDELDTLVVKHNVQNIYNRVLEKALPFGLICWCHIFVCSWELDYYADNSNIKKVVFVSREEYDMYIDHRGRRKFTYIYNCVNTDASRRLYVNSKKNENRENVVTYVGSLVPYKGFHLLAQAWPKIKASIPDAKLNIIGTGKLYNCDQSLGRWGLAESSYEEQFMQYLTQDGELVPDVHFWGVLGEEKNAILLKTKVGVPNPSGISETFCLSAVEMQMLGAKVTSICFPGLLDTIHYGKTYRKTSQLADSVISMLTSDYGEYEQAMLFFEDNFSYDSVASKWEELLFCGDIKLPKGMIHPLYRLKFLKYFISFVKERIPIFRRLPVLERGLVWIERKVNGKVTYIDT